MSLFMDDVSPCLDETTPFFYFLAGGETISSEILTDSLTQAPAFRLQSLLKCPVTIFTNLMATRATLYETVAIVY